MLFVVVLEKLLKFALVEDNDCVVDNSRLVALRDFDGNIGSKRLKTLAV